MFEMIPDWLLVLFVTLVAFPLVSFCMIIVFFWIPSEVVKLFTRDKE